MLYWKIIGISQLGALAIWLVGNFIVLSCGWPVKDDLYWFDSEGEVFSLVMFWVLQVTALLGTLHTLGDNYESTSF